VGVTPMKFRGKIDHGHNHAEKNSLHMRGSGGIGPSLLPIIFSRLCQLLS
jgi:hypothetical protein